MSDLLIDFSSLLGKCSHPTVGCGPIAIEKVMNDPKEKLEFMHFVCVLTRRTIPEFLCSL